METNADLHPCYSAFLIATGVVSVVTLNENASALWSNDPGEHTVPRT